MVQVYFVLFYFSLVQFIYIYVILFYVIFVLFEFSATSTVFPHEYSGNTTFSFFLNKYFVLIQSPFILSLSPLSIHFYLFPPPNFYRHCISLFLQSFSDFFWLTFFPFLTSFLFSSRFSLLFSPLLNYFISLQVRVKQEMVNEEARIKSTVLSLEEPNFISECQQMFDAIMKYQQIENLS